MVIDDSTKQKVRSLHSSGGFFFLFFFFLRHLYYDDNEGGGKSEAALLKLFKQHGHTWLLTKGSAEFVSASASSLISAGRRVGLKQQNFKDLEIACSLINICSRSGKWTEIAHQMASSNAAGLQLTPFINWKATPFLSWAMTFHLNSENTTKQQRYT